MPPRLLKSRLLRRPAAMLATLSAMLAAALVLALVPAAAEEPHPEGATGWTGRERVVAEDYMVVAAHPVAAQTGYDVLRAGGSAVDAMIAVQLVLNLVEPQSSGIGGGAFMLYFDAAHDAITAYDGRETAPMAADEALFLDRNGAPLAFWDAVIGGLSVGTPGTLALLEAAHRDHGRLPWAELFEPAITLAESGFTVTPRLASLLRSDAGDRLRTYAPARSYFFPDGVPLRAGDVRDNPAFADTLRLVAENGTQAFYTGEIAEDIVVTVRTAEGNPGLLAPEDLAGYEVIRRRPVCFLYRDYDVCGMGPPSSGALTIGQILGLLEHFDLATPGPRSADSWHLFVEASKLAFADRAVYMADSDFVRVPTAGLLDRAYLTYRAQLVSLDAVLPVPVAAGNPPWRAPVRRAPDLSVEQPGTSHIAIIDADGNALSMTTTIESAFGSGLMARGFLLNNELTDFSFVPERDGRPVANRVEPGKRPRSSMAPTLVFDSAGDLYLVVGSPGGSRIIGYVAKTLVGVLDWGLDIQAAIELPNVTNRNGVTGVEAGRGAGWLAETLAARGHDVTVDEMPSGLHGIQVTGAGYVGGADPRREGVALGD